MEIKMNKPETLSCILRRGGISSQGIDRPFSSYVGMTDTDSKCITVNECILSSFEIGEKILKHGKEHPEMKARALEYTTDCYFTIMQEAFRMAGVNSINSSHKPVFDSIAIDVIEKHPLAALAFLTSKSLISIDMDYECSNDSFMYSGLYLLCARTLAASMKRYGVERLLKLAYECDNEITHDVLMVAMGHIIYLSHVDVNLVDLIYGRNIDRLYYESNKSALVHLGWARNVFDIMERKSDFIIKQKNVLFNFETSNKEFECVNLGGHDGMTVRIPLSVFNFVKEAIIENIKTIGKDYGSILEKMIMQSGNTMDKIVGTISDGSIISELVNFTDKYTNKSDVHYSGERGDVSVIGKYCIIAAISNIIVSAIPSTEMDFEDYKHLADVVIG